MMLTAAGLTIVLTVFAVRTAPAYERYNDGCQNCHGAFDDDTSPKGTIFPGNDKHQMHRSSSSMNTECDLCHMAGTFDNPFIGESAGTPNNPGVGCVGCHGRDYGGTLGNSGVGLRLHHTINGVGICAGCHQGDPTPLGEDVLPTYYGTVDTLVDDPCNAGPAFLENWSVGDTEGLDNDGDNLYDGDDPDCSGIPCPADTNGDGVVDVVDLLEVLASWGPCAGCPADINNDNIVDVLDLLELLAAWGPCP
jgi:hypothetical protein